MKRRLILLLIIVVSACSTGSKKNPAPTASVPTKPLLASPAANSICILGTVISATQSSVTFQWNTSTNTDMYEIFIENLLTLAVKSQTTSQTQLLVNLLSDTPYSWYIVSKSNATTETSKSDTWKFYNSGPGVVTYAPFPAEIVAPKLGEAVTAMGGKINLSWKGGSVNPETISNFDVYLWIGNGQPTLLGMTTDSFYNDVAVTYGSTYSWKVVTRDIQGNTSDSGVYTFMVN